MKRISLRSALPSSATMAILIVLLFFLSSCAHTADVSSCVQDIPAGFWKGLWHGIIAPFSFIISLFSDDVTIYAVHNNGNWYNFGFVLGAGILFGGGGQAKKRR